jgi:hypothetical protein
VHGAKHQNSPLLGLYVIDSTASARRFGQAHLLLPFDSWGAAAMKSWHAVPGPALPASRAQRVRVADLLHLQQHRPRTDRTAPARLPSAGSGLGRFAGVRIPPSTRASALWARAAALFTRWGLLGIYLTRFLLTPVALPVNLLAGSRRYPWPRYLAAVVAGEATWVGLFGGAGYAFSQQWESISNLVADAGGILLGGALVVVASRWLWRRRQQPGS